jgi:hypothetical protein
VVLAFSSPGLCVGQAVRRWRGLSFWTGASSVSSAKMVGRQVAAQHRIVGMRASRLPIPEAVRDHEFVVTPALYAKLQLAHRIQHQSSEPRLIPSPHFLPVRTAA